MKTIAIVGAGPGLGLSIARKFCKNGFQVALVARNKEKLNRLVAELKQEGIEAAAFTQIYFTGAKLLMPLTK